MKANPPSARVQELPPHLQARLLEFQRSVWTVKILEGIFAGLFGLLISFLLVFILDRFWETPATLRAVILVAGASGFGYWFPTKFHQWVWQKRSLEQVARLLKHRFPRLGDQLLGIVELAHHSSGSDALVKAAFEQVDQRVREQSFKGAVPRARHFHWGLVAGAFCLVAIAALFAVPKAGWNALSRWVAPWKDTERYTFAQMEQKQRRIPVAYAEPYDLNVALGKSTDWKPEGAEARFRDQDPVKTPLVDDKYAFAMQPRTETGKLKISVGDDRQEVEIVPTYRPEMAVMKATVRLPDYLRYSREPVLEVREGAISLVKGSEASFVATTTSDVASAYLNGIRQHIEGKNILLDSMFVAESETRTLSWKDPNGLTSKKPFELRVNAFDDAAPDVAAKIMTQEQVILETDVVKFDVRAGDEFGVREVGLAWVGSLQSNGREPDRGEKVTAGGAPEQLEIVTEATFSAKRERVKPQTIQIAAYAVDYLPGRKPSYSKPFVLHIVTPEQHAVWVTDQFGKWFRQAQEVYEREKQLHATNKELRALSAEELDKEENRRKIENQAASESANGKRLENLTDAGKELVEQAARNHEFDAERLELWAQMLEQLKEIGGQKMPSVADLLKDAAKAENAPKLAQNDPAKPQKPEIPDPGRSLPVSEDKGQDKPKAGQDGGGAQKPGPSISDKESGFMPEVAKKEGEQQPKAPAGGSSGLSLPSTSLAAVPSNKPQEPPSPAQQETEKAVVEQTGLLDEFEKIANQLKELLGSLEGSTFVKRLKAASREQLAVANDLNETLINSFGRQGRDVSEEMKAAAAKIAEREHEQSTVVHTIQDDIEAYFHRKQDLHYKKVLEQMRETAVVAELREIGETVKTNFSGRSILAAEYWADTMDRWAEEMVSASQCKACSSRDSDSLPPEVVLEVMKLLHEEIKLREETRELEKAKSAIDEKQYQNRAHELAVTQRELRDRSFKVIKDIILLPQGADRFPKPIELMTEVARVMNDAQQVLSRPDTGPEAIAAETEAIELLLKARRSNPNGGGGGGGADPGGGGGAGGRGRTALSGLGAGADPGAKIEDRNVDQATGKGGRVLPEEFRSGLDSYFNALERGNGK